MSEVRISGARAAGNVALAIVLGLAAAPALAVQFPVTGSVSVGGEGGELPPGTFGDSSYDGSSGELSSGKFAFPTTSVTFDSPLGPVVATYQFEQTNQASATVDTDGIVAFSEAKFRISILSARLGGVIPINIGPPCVFEPIEIFLAGTADGSGMSVSDPAFTVPPAPEGNCGDYRDQINDALAGAEQGIELFIEGDFTPPPEGNPDLIFVNGFEYGP